MKNSKKFINSFQQLKSSSFISINNYLAKTTGEVANHVINVNLSVKTAKERDLNTLLNCNENDLLNIENSQGIALDILRTALSELIASAEKNLSENTEDRTAQSQAQTDAYIHLTPAIRLHKDTMEIHVFGQAISKTVLVKGQYKTVNSKPLTIAKNTIKKHLDLRADKFRDFIVGHIDKIKINGETLEVQ
jgi:hypothetical protein